jgi:hypothetical protein
VRELAIDERGSGLVEVIIGLPLLVLAVLSGFQLFFVAASDASARNAARAGARAASLHGDGAAAATEALAVWLRPSAGVTVNTADDAARVRVEVHAPQVLPLMPAEILSRSFVAVMPVE